LEGSDEERDRGGVEDEAVDEVGDFSDGKEGEWEFVLYLLKFL
jgi:hypothetical protein